MCVEEIWDFIFRAHQRPGFCNALYFAYRVLFLGHSGPRRSSQFAFKQMLLACASYLTILGTKKKRFPAPLNITIFDF